MQGAANTLKQANQAYKGADMASGGQLSGANQQQAPVMTGGMAPPPQAQGVAPMQYAGGQNPMMAAAAQGDPYARQSLAELLYGRA
jgi:hypothetical protein